MALLKNEFNPTTNVRHKIIHNNIEKINRAHLNIKEQSILDRIIDKSKTNPECISTSEFNWLNDIANTVKY